VEQMSKFQANSMANNTNDKSCHSDQENPSK